MSTSSLFSYTGDISATLNSLTGETNVTPLNLSDLSTNNYPTGDPNNSPPNADNQLIFMKQSMSWWVTQLNCGNISYIPLSNYVNWTFKNSSRASIHIGMPISNLLIPNSVKTSTFDPQTKVMTLEYNMKFGMGRTDTQQFMVGATGS